MLRSEQFAWEILVSLRAGAKPRIRDTTTNVLHSSTGGTSVRRNIEWSVIRFAQLRLVPKTSRETNQASLPSRIREPRLNLSIDLIKVIRSHFFSIVNKYLFFVSTARLPLLYDIIALIGELLFQKSQEMQVGKSWHVLKTLWNCSRELFIKIQAVEYQHVWRNRIIVDMLVNLMNHVWNRSEKVNAHKFNEA